MKRLSLITSLFLIILASTFASKVSLDAKDGNRIQIIIEIIRDRKSYELSATLFDNSSASAFYSALKQGPITVDMSDYGNFEKVGRLGMSLPRNDKWITTEPGDIILYQGNQITIYYDENTWNFTHLGKIDSLSPSELRSILGDGNIKAVFKVK